MIDLFKILLRVKEFLFYILKNSWLAKFLLVFSFFLLLLDYASMSIMLPLSNPSGSGIINGYWRIILNYLGLDYNSSVLIWLFLVILSLRLIVGYVHSILAINLAKSVHKDLSSGIFRHILNDIGLSSIYKNKIGYYISLAGDDTFKAGNLINQFFIILSQLSSVIVGFILLALYSFDAFWITIVFFAISSIFVIKYLKRISSINIDSVRLSQDAGSVFLEGLNSLRSIRAMHAQKYIYDSYFSKFNEYIKMLKVIEYIKLSIKIFPAFIAILLGLYIFNPWVSDQIILSTDKIFAGMVIVVRLFISLGALMTVLGSFIVDFRSVRDISTLIKINSDIHTNFDFKSTNLAKSCLHTLELSNISYSHNSESSTIKNFSYKFDSGSTYAIIGPSGAGKSTLGDLMSGLINADSGTITFDGVDRDSLYLSHVVRLIEQNPKLFTGTIRDNLKFSNDVSDDFLWEALAVVDLKDFVKALPNGLDELINYQGDNFSGGQRQRLAIARSLINASEVVIFDEATSALDSITRDYLLSAIKKYLSSRILIFITHDGLIEESVDQVVDLSKFNG